MTSPGVVSLDGAPTCCCHGEPGAVAVHLRHVLGLDGPAAVRTLVRLPCGDVPARCKKGRVKGRAGKGSSGVQRVCIRCDRHMLREAG